MDIILKEDISTLGHKDDIISVKNGYARNYLIPKGLAINATAPARKVHAEILRQRAHKEAKLIDSAKEAAQKLEGVSLKIGAKTFYNSASKELEPLMVGYSYDFTTSAIGRNGRSSGSHEIMLGYCFQVDIPKPPPTGYKNVRFL